MGVCCIIIIEVSKRCGIISELGKVQRGEREFIRYLNNFKGMQLIFRRYLTGLKRKHYAISTQESTTHVRFGSCYSSYAIIFQSNLKYFSHTCKFLHRTLKKHKKSSEKHSIHFCNESRTKVIEPEMFLYRL